MVNFENTDCITNWEQYQRYFEIDMSYEKEGLSDRQIGRRKIEICMLLAGRFGFVSPLVLEHTFALQRTKVLQLLNRLVGQRLLKKVTTPRARDGVIYVLTHAGAQYASDLMQVDVYFRSTRDGFQGINQSAIFHDSILQFVLMAGIQNRDANGHPRALWKSFITEKEFRRLYNDNTKHVDGLVISPDNSVSALEIENSYKTKAQRKATLLKLNQHLTQPNKLFDLVFYVCSSDKVLSDLKRFNNQLLEELPELYSKKIRGYELSQEQANMLEEKLIYRTKLTQVITQTFYS